MHLQDPIIFVTLSVDTKIVKSGGNVITAEAIKIKWFFTKV